VQGPVAPRMEFLEDTAKTARSSPRLVGRVIADGDVLLRERISTLRERSSLEVVGLAGEVTSA